MRGRSILPLLDGEQPRQWKSDIFAQHDLLRCCRTSEWKLVRNLVPNQPDELYNLSTDPEEHQNRIGDISIPRFGKIHDELTGKLLGWMSEIGDPLFDEAGDCGGKPRN